MASDGPKGDISPNNTLYINNLNEKTSKDELKKGLYFVFSPFGNILEVMASKTYKMRGQAWVIYEDLNSAARALASLQNFNFFGKPMRVSFAKQKSDVIAKIDGTFKPRPKRKADDQKDAVPKHIQDKKRKEEKLKALGLLSDATTPSATAAAGGVSGMEVDVQPPKPSYPPAPVEPPNKILFVQNLPPEITTMSLTYLFKDHPGFKEVRLVAGSSGIAFVEFENEQTAQNSMMTLQNFKVTPEHPMRISFARK